LFTGLIPAALGLLNVILYNLIYTPLKRVTSLAVIPGSAVGAIPPLIGFTAAGDKMLSPEILLFASFMFLWQLPHFWLIIMKYRDDYYRAGFKTFSSKMTEKNIRNLIFLWVFVSTVFLILVMREGVFFNRLLLALLIPLNAGFIVYFYHLLYRNTGLVSANKAAFMLVNSFGLVIMLMFIINAFL
jgi:protoheme IX farnesyltransferase